MYSVSSICVVTVVFIINTIRCSIPQTTRWSIHRSNPSHSTYSTTVLHPSETAYFCRSHTWLGTIPHILRGHNLIPTSALQCGGHHSNAVIREWFHSSMLLPEISLWREQCLQMIIYQVGSKLCDGMSANWQNNDPAWENIEASLLANAATRNTFTERMPLQVNLLPCYAVQEEKHPEICNWVFTIHMQMALWIIVIATIATIATTVTNKLARNLGWRAVNVRWAGRGSDQTVIWERRGCD